MFIMSHYTTTKLYLCLICDRMVSCVFCKIVSKKINSFKVFEDQLFLGFLDVNPRTYGHTLLIPKKHYRWTYDVPEFELYWKAAHKVATTIQTVLTPKFITFATHGLEIPHAHIHIMPRKNESGFVPQQIKVKKSNMLSLSKEMYKHAKQST